MMRVPPVPLPSPGSPGFFLSVNTLFTGGTAQFSPILFPFSSPIRHMTACRRSCRFSKTAALSLSGLLRPALLPL